MGDKSDNVPGIPGVGKKTATKWLNEFKTLENLIDNAEKITGKIGQKLNSNLDLLPTSKELVAINKKVDIRKGFISHHKKTRRFNPTGNI